MFNWGSLLEVIRLVLEIFLRVMNSIRESKLKKQGADEKEKEIEKNEKLVRDTLSDTDVSSLPDDEAFKPRRK